MADFKTALEALKTGKLELDVLSQQIQRLLEDNPRYANRILSQLEEVFAGDNIDEAHYTELKRLINDFRREHAAQTEEESGGADATVFEQVGVMEEADETTSEFADESPDESEDITVQPGTGTGDDLTGGNLTDGDLTSDDLTSDDLTGDDPSEDATIQTVQPDVTQVMDTGDGGDATQVMDAGDGDDVTQAMDTTGSDSSVDFDLMTGDISDSSASTGTTASSPGGELGPGDVIKQRFKLLDVLGVGGMGKVYKGIDLLKEEARDKNPYMAIKLLNEDFKSHPEAFISLQRESSRQQKLAHPNIATVYDFDRIGGRGTPVYITMELMEGQPLNTYIKKTVRKQGGLPFDEALVIVQQLGAALTYAHDRRLVHSDFKPGNAFLCTDGTVKTLDFGIARAVKNPVTGEAEKTLFDPGKLGALTPAYASLEMLEGEEPDTRDDTYALGCVAYELLTGRHPFNKLPATTARENGLVPAPVKGLNKKSNRALRRALAFKREDRSPNVPHFIEEFEGKPTWHKNPLTIAAGILLLIGVIMINPALDYFHEKGMDSLITGLNTGDRQLIVDTLSGLGQREKADQSRIIDEARGVIEKYFAREIARRIDTSGETYSFPGAEKILAHVGELYPETKFYLDQRANIQANRKSKEAELYQQYIAAVDPEAVKQDPNIINSTRDILDILRTRIDANHPLLDDPRPSNAYRLAAQQAFDEQNLTKASELVASGLQTAPDDARLQDLSAKITNTILIAELNERLGGRQIASLDEFKQNQSDIEELASLSTPADSPVLDTLSIDMKKSITEELNKVLSEGGREDAVALAGEYGALLNSLQLANELIKVKLAHLSGDERTNEIQNIITTEKTAIDEKLANPQIDSSEWETQLLASVLQLDALTEDDQSVAGDLKTIRDSIAELYVDEAGSTLSANRFDAADGLVDRAERFAPGLALLQDTRNLVAETKTEFEKQERIKDLKEQFRVQSEADNVADAAGIFDKLKMEMPADDSYIKTTAPNTLAESYYRLALNRAESGDTLNAYKLVTAGLELNPKNFDLQDLKQIYEVEVNIAELSDLFQTADVFTEEETLNLSRQINQISRGDPARYAEFIEQSEKILSERIQLLAQSDKNSAAALASASSYMFPASSLLADLSRQFELEPWPGVAEAQTTVNNGELSKAGVLLQDALNSEYSGHPQVLGFQKVLEEKIQEANGAYDRYLAAKDAAGESFSKLRQTKKLLARAQAEWMDNPDYDAAESDIDNLIANAPDNPSKKVIRREQVDIAQATQEDLIKAQAEWKPISSGRECQSRLAGHGKRARAICFDLVNIGWRGPLMVVIPSDDNGASQFAIGKYEVSVGDYSKYCALTGNCKPETSKNKLNDPITGISLTDAQKYVDWLSGRTGKTYRLPTRSEWEYAANASGNQPRKDVNCRVTLGDKVLKGTGIVSVRSGRSNGWGLKNYVGNVQEWIIDDDGTMVAGGSYSDAHSKCDISLQRPHDGGSDETTGFRVVLEEIG